MKKDDLLMMKKNRDTNLELFRIITMLLIIAHHYVVNSGLTSYGSPLLENLMSKRALCVIIFGAWGKMGINCFLLITGYFMCKSSITVKKYMKLILEVLFYRIAIAGIFWITGYTEFSFSELLQTMIPVTDISDGFTSTYLIFFLCIPFLNILIHNMSQKQHIYCVLLVSFIYVFFGTFKMIFHVTMNYVSWYMVVYLIAAYVRIYPHEIFEKVKLWGGIAIGLIVFCCIFTIYDVLNNSRLYYHVTDSNTFLALATAFSMFMFFKNVRIPYVSWINKLAASCFGVLQIHAQSDAMRKWLWQDVCNNVGMFYSKWLPVHAIGSVFVIFIVCSAIDMLRVSLIERPFFSLWDKYWNDIKNLYVHVERRIMEYFDVTQE